MDIEQYFLSKGIQPPLHDTVFHVLKHNARTVANNFLATPVKGTLLLHFTHDSRHVDICLQHYLRQRRFAANDA